MISNEELVPLEGSKSPVWKYFGFPAKDGHIIQGKKERKTDLYAMFDIYEILRKHH